ncbi:hypothetical protein JB92DRAFT_2925354, partial [Gautieria morchelliformis]
MAQCPSPKRLPIPICKQIIKQTSVDPDYLHRCCGIVQYTAAYPFSAQNLLTLVLDLKPDNLLLRKF